MPRHLFLANRTAQEISLWLFHYIQLSTIKSISAFYFSINWNCNQILHHKLMWTIHLNQCSIIIMTTLILWMQLPSTDRRHTDRTKTMAVAVYLWSIINSLTLTTDLHRQKRKKVESYGFQLKRYVTNSFGALGPNREKQRSQSTYPHNNIIVR